MNSRFSVVLVLASVAFLCATARGSIIVDHQPLNSGGPGADTSFINDSAHQTWQLVGDEVLLSRAATVRSLSWWGFYGGSFSGSPFPPSGPETMRVRFYAPRAGDGLPGEVLYEESFLNPSRTETGRIVLVGLGPKEYLYQADLSVGFELAPNTPYWLEIVQVGDPASTFRWEYSVNAEANGYAFWHGAIPDWQHTVNTPGDLAFQLSNVPELSYFALLLGCGVLACGTRSWRRGCANRERERGKRRIIQLCQPAGRAAASPTSCLTGGASCSKRDP